MIDILKTAVATPRKAGLGSAFRVLMPRPSTATTVLWFLPAVLQLAVAASALRRRLWRDMPIFLSYTVWHIIRPTITYWLRCLGSYPSYFYTFWWFEALDAILSFVVIRELYANLFGRYERLNKISNVLFVWASILLAVVGTTTAATATGSEGTRVVRGVLAFQMADSILGGGLLLLLFAMSSVLKLRWKDALLGVAFGFALFISFDLVSNWWNIRVGEQNSFGILLRTLPYNCATIIWVVYCLRKQSEILLPGAVSHSDLERWNRELAGFL